jgi:very-short-patch-repair endonuclease
MTAEAAAAAMRRQAGVISRQQAHTTGLTDRQIHRLLAQRRWTPVLPGVYLSAETTLSWRAWAHAALLGCGVGAVLIGETAAALRSLVPETLPITVAIPEVRRCRWRSDAIRVLRTDVADSERVTVDGLLTTTRLRTALDIAHLMPLAQAQPVLDRMLVLDHVDLAALTEAVAASRRAGSAQARRLLKAANDRAAAESERIARQLFTRAGITGWVANHRVSVGGRWIKVDLALPRWRIAVEVKGWMFHSLADRARGDDRRIADLGIAGWIVIPVGWLELTTDPTAVVARVQAAIASRQRTAS